MRQDKIMILIQYIELFEINENVIVTDSNHEVLYCTQPAAGIFNTTPEELMRIKKISLLEGAFIKKIAGDVRKLLLPLESADKRSRLISLCILDNPTHVGQRHCFLWEVLRMADFGFKYTLHEAKFDRLYHSLGLINYLRMPQKKVGSKPAVSSIVLSDRDREILYLLMFGLSYKDIAAILSRVYNREINAAAITTYIHNTLLNKLNSFSVDEFISSQNFICDFPQSLIAKLDPGFITVEYR